MDTKPSSASIFISYATHDRPRALEICNYLELEGHACWIAPRNIRAGHDYGEEIIRGIENSRCLVLVLSSSANKSIYVKREVERAVSKAKPVFPVRIEDVMPSPALELHLASLHYLDAWNGALKEHILKLARDLNDDSFTVEVSGFPLKIPIRRKRLVVFAAGGAAIMLSVIIGWWAITPTTLSSKQQQSDQAASIRATIEDIKKKQAQLASAKITPLSCSALTTGPILRCVGELGLRVHLHSAQSEEVIFSSGSEANASPAKAVSGHRTFLPWIGLGSTFQVEPEAGNLLPAQPLPDIRNMAAAVNIPSVDKNAPPLFYTLTQLGPDTVWWYLFFAPTETADVEWSTDNSGFIRAEAAQWQRPSGSEPFWIRGSQAGDAEIRIRWRKSAADWSEPVLYQGEISHARSNAVKPLQDLVDSVACYKDANPAFPAHVRCKNRRAIPLAYLFQDLRWGLNSKELIPVETFDFSRWASLALQESLKVPPLPTGPHSECKGNGDCEKRKRYEDSVDHHNAEVGSARKAESILGSTRLQFGPWQTGKSSFLAISPYREDVFFQATPVGGGQPLTARIAVSAQEPR